MAQDAAGGGQEVAGQEGEQQGGNYMFRFMFQAIMIWVVMQFMGNRNKKQQAELVDTGSNLTAPGKMRPGQMKNLFGVLEECELFVHLSPPSWKPGASSAQYKLSFDALTNESLGRERGLTLLWHQRVWYEPNAPEESINVTVPPLPVGVLTGVDTGPYILATLFRVSDGLDAAEDHVVRQALPLVTKMRELNLASDTGNLFGEDEDGMKPKKNLSSPKLPYFKQKIDVRPVVDQTVHSPASLQQGPFKKLRGFPERGYYQPYIFLSDFWLLEKDFTPLNTTLEDQPLNLTLSYTVITALKWSLQSQMLEQWSVQGEWGLTDTQRDSFMFKRLMIDTNPYLLAFSGVFLMLHTVFSLLAFKNDIQFWRKNESMQGLSARSMVVAFVCQFITTLYLLDSQETSRLILFNICLDTALSTWKLRKAVKVEVNSAFPFLHLSGQKGYENAGTSKYDDEAVRYMVAILAPLFVGYSIRSAVYGKHRGWYSFLVGSAAGGVYTFGFIMMTPQLYINYKLKSVEHLPWRALTYKAMNTFVDDIAALLIDMPMMHRLSCFRDDIIFFVYIYQRWKYRVDKTRPSMWVEQPEPVADAPATAAVSNGTEGAPEAASEEKANEEKAKGETDENENKAAPDAKGAANKAGSGAQGKEARKRK